MSLVAYYMDDGRPISQASLQAGEREYDTPSQEPSLNVRELREELRQELEEEFTAERKADVWRSYAEAVKTHHDELVERWQAEMDNILIYAGLFSAVLTGFNVQSYQLLLPTIVDPSLAVLQQISQQLSSFSLGPSFVNSTHPARPVDQIQPPFHAPTSAILINALWFPSLIFSLASASIALMVKQWLHDISVGLSGTSPRDARRRQYRHNSLRTWQVGIIVLIPSILLQLALVMFLSGLLALLWTLHRTVAIVGTILIGMLFLFLVIVVTLPLFRWDCCYRTPQAQAIYVMARQVLRSTSHVLRFCGGLLRSLLGIRIVSFLRRIPSPLRIIDKMPTWRGREERHLSSAAQALDCSTAVMAFTTTYDFTYLHTLHVVLQDLSMQHFKHCFNDIVAAHKEQWGTEPYMTDRFRTTVLARPLLYAIRCIYTAAVRPRWGTPREREIDRVCEFMLDQVDAGKVDDVDYALTTFALLGTGDGELVRKGYEKMHTALKHRKASCRLSYRSIRYVMTACQWYFDKWKPEPSTAAMDRDMFLEYQLRPLYGILVCAKEALFPYTLLSPEQTQAVCSQTRVVLSTFKENLNSFDWEQLLPTATLDPSRPRSRISAPSEGPVQRRRLPRRSPSIPDDLGVLNWFRLRFSFNVVEPITALCENPRSAQVVPEGTVEALQRSWTAVKASMDARFHLQGSRSPSPAPAMLEAQDGRYLPPNARRSIREFEGRLEKLRQIVTRNVTGEENSFLLAHPDVSVQVPSPSGSAPAVLRS
ncbi:hypothetical protein BD310DRAFT_976645 [Dichomitus squalens]|uniref:DUF6535 domain-containing protein n=1 Tax=Dichomitus squalens TaxID=114155 RepID=A0A4V2K8B9_9APHY|nr:hypothetical protein BD310DRAFT_976645 [Dichomitus squalens]